jgi:NodT family efflux transporter outer membrane factor (OMF) lipoprotein
MARFVPLLLFVPMLAGCVSNRLPEPKVAVPTGFETPQPVPVSALQIDRWWLAFNDPQLTALVEQALVSAPDTRTAFARLREAQAVRRGALSSYDPQGDPSGLISHSDTRIDSIPAAQANLLGAGKADSGGGSFTVSWEIDLFGRRAAARRAADADLAATRFDYEATRLSLAASVASQLFDARGLAAQIVEAEQTLRIAEDLARVGRLRVTSGIGSESDSARLDTQLANAQADLLNQRALFTNARRTLLVLLGRGVAPLETLPIEAMLPVPPRPPALTPGEVMARRPDVREAEQRVRSAAGTLRLSQLALFPRLTLQSGASITHLLSPIGYTETAWSVAAGLFVPVLDRAMLRSQIGAQTARGEQAVIAYEHAVQSAYGDAEKSLTSLNADLGRLDRLSFAEQRAHVAFTAQQQGYTAGIVSIDTLLQTEQAWRASRIALVVIKTGTLTDAVTAFQALGGGWTPDQTKGS